jgi:hypothetical protein
VKTLLARPGTHVVLTPIHRHHYGDMGEDMFVIESQVETYADEKAPSGRPFWIGLSVDAEDERGVVRMRHIKTGVSVHAPGSAPAQPVEH